MDVPITRRSPDTEEEQAITGNQIANRHVAQQRGLSISGPFDLRLEQIRQPIGYNCVFNDPREA